MSESASNHDNLLPSQEFDQLLYRIGNHEGKTAAAAILLDQPGNAFKPYQLRHEIKNSQGNDPAWVPARPIICNYCSGDFVPSNLAVQRDDQFQANPEYLMERRIFCDEILGWSLDFPGTSVQKVLGQTAAGQEHFGPVIRHAVCAVIAKNTDRELSQSDIVERLTTKRGDLGEFAVRNTIIALTRQEILESKRLDITTDVRLYIQDPDFHGTKAFEQLSTLTRLTYLTFKALSDQGKRIIDFNDFRDQALAIDPQVDPYALRNPWHVASNESAKNFPGVTCIERAITDPSKLSNVHFHPNHKEAVINLVERIEAARTGIGIEMSEGRFVSPIVNDTTAMRQIFAKARHFSAAKKKTEQPTDGIPRIERIFEVIKTEGTVDAKTIAENLHTRDNPITVAVINKYLKRLIGEGRIIRESKTRTPASGRQILHYTAVPSEEN
ncbi:MAG TPA: hypothetical protein VF733_03980 [Candidatus Saccharimonadales bacterium]